MGKDAKRDYPTKSRLNTSQHSPYGGIASAYLSAAGLLPQKVLDFRMCSIAD
jgi:hypothetical protein